MSRKRGCSPDQVIAAANRGGGPGYQTRINAVLRAFVEPQVKRIARRQKPHD